MAKELAPQKRDCTTCWKKFDCQEAEPGTYCLEYRSIDVKPPKREPVAPEDETEGGVWE